MYCFDQTNKTFKKWAVILKQLFITQRITCSIIISYGTYTQPVRVFACVRFNFGEQTREQFVPKCPFLQAIGQNKRN